MISCSPGASTPYQTSAKRRAHRSTALRKWWRPTIGRIKVAFSTDQNASLARMLAGEVDYAADAAIGGQQAVTLKQSWGPKGGSILVKLDYFRSAVAQLRPEQAIPAAIMDVR